MKPVCVKCKCYMSVGKNGAPVTEYLKGDEKPYSVTWYDWYECPECKTAILANPGNAIMHYSPLYYGAVESAKRVGGIRVEV